MIAEVPPAATPTTSFNDAGSADLWKGLVNVCAYHCSTCYKAVRYYKAVRVGGGGGTMEGMCYERLRAEACVLVCACVFFLYHVCIYYCSTYYKAVREGGGGMEDMCYERLRAKAGVN